MPGLDGYARASSQSLLCAVMHSAIRGFGWRRADRFFIVSSLGNRRGRSPFIVSFVFLLVSQALASAGS
jgi:hypothetical protein